MRSLFVSHTGMLEPLGQSQVLPYLGGLAQAGWAIEIVSFEPPGSAPAEVEALRERLSSSGIAWHPMVRSPSHALPVKLWEAGRAVLRGLAGALSRRPDIVHARSHLPAAVADAIASTVPGAKLLFDCRGLLADEYVDGGHWRRGDYRYGLVKAFERRLFRRAEGVVVLTDALRRWLDDERLLGPHTRVQVIPCCVDTARFRIDDPARQRTRAKLGLDGRTVIVYSGTLGSWYRERDMARFAGLAKRARPDVALLLLTRAATDGFRAAAREAGLGDDDLRVLAVPPAEMPAMLAAGDLGLSFIDPCFSKIGSSPTKVAEYLACGVPAVVNGDIGDQANLAADPAACVVLPALDGASLERAVAPALALATGPLAARRAAARAVAERRFSLTGVGVPAYQAIYEALVGGSAARSL